MEANSNAGVDVLSGYDFILLIDKSGSMATADCPGGMTRWKAAEEATIALAAKCASFDDDGISIYPFNNNFKEYKNVTGDPNAVARIFKENEPSNSTDTGKVLEHVLGDYLTRKSANAETKPIIVLCITDGAPNDKNSVATAIINASNKISSDDEIGITFLQVGQDTEAKEFLRSLDDDLQSKGAKYDIVDTKTMDEIGEMSMADVLLAALND